MASAPSAVAQPRELSIAFVVNDMGYGGAELQVADLAIRMRRLGHTVTVIVLARFVDLRDVLNAAGIRTIALGMRYGRPSVGGAVRLAAALRSVAPDVVHAHLLGASVMSRLARILCPVPVHISTAHTPFESSAVRYAALALTDPWTDVCTNVCAEGLETFVRRGAFQRRKSLHTPNGIDVARFARPADRSALREMLGMSPRFTWLAVGSFRTEQKDYGTMAEAVLKLESAGLDYEVWIAGVGALQEEKRRLFGHLGIDHRLRLLGLRRDVPELMLAADAYLMSSAWEAFPLVLLEASAAGLPVVATNVGDAAAIVRHGESGFVVPARDPEALGRAMARLMQMPSADRLEMGNRGRQHVSQEYAIDGVVERWLRLYDEALERRGGGGS